MERKFLQIDGLCMKAIADLAVAYLNAKAEQADELAYLFSTTYTDADIAQANDVGIRRREHARRKKGTGVRMNPDDSAAQQYELEGVLGELLTQKLFEQTTEHEVSFAPLFSEDRSDFSKPDMTLDGVSFDTKTASSRYHNLAININGHSQSVVLHGITYYLCIHFSAEFVADWYVVKASSVENWELFEAWRNKSQFYRAPFPKLKS